MTERLKNKGTHGFSLVETLAVVAILAILLSLSAVAAAYYRDYLKITELDNAAREIYMAAENRAVLLDSGGRLDGALADGGAVTLADGEDGPLYITHKGSDGADSSALGGLLTSGAIDPALLEGDFHIVYDPASGAVTDVFYTEKSGIQDIRTSFELAARGRDARMRPDDGPMLGYYGGEQAEREDYTPLPAPEVMVVVHNGDLLTVDVTFSVPESAQSLVGNWMFDAAQTVKLEYGGKRVWLLLVNPPGEELSASVARNWSSRSISGSSITYTWVLDALDTSSAVGRHFWQLFSDDPGDAPACGGDFTVTAEIELSASGRRSTSASGSDSGNSLFAEHSGGTAARLENLRHLQNLDSATSNAGGKTSAVQLNDIDCCGRQSREPYGLYAFKPIVNEELRSFDGGWTAGGGQNRRNELTDLLVTAESAAGKPGAGLFAETADGMSFTGVRLLNADVKAASAAGVLVGSAGTGSTFREIRVVNSKAVCTDGPAGGVAGKVAGASGKENSFTDCQVYWEPEEDQENLRSLLGSDQENNFYKYSEIIRGTGAGGLAGELSGSSGKTTVKKSLAAALVSGTIAGGLIGDAQHTLDVSVSYADCYIKGTTHAAGLAGKSKTGGTSAGASFENAYAAGFIDVEGMSSNACIGGIVNVGGTVRGVNVYSAVSYLNWRRSEEPDSTYAYTGGIPDNGGGLFTNCRYLIPQGGSAGDQAQAGHMTFDEMSEKDFAASMGTAFEFKGYRSAGSDSRNTYPYNLQEKQNLTQYSFPGLKGLPHYGDWQAYFKEPSLVYYEQYDERDPETREPARKFSGGNARTLKLGQLEEGAASYPTIQTDGYAVALLQTDLEGETRFTVTYTYPGVNGEAVTKDVTYVTGAPAGDQIQLLSATWTRQEGGEEKTDLYWLAPLPDELVSRQKSSPDFYQYLKFEAVLSSGENGKTASGEYFYNPHFAETVKPYVPAENGAPLVDWTAPGSALETIREYITGALIPGTAPVSVSVRTPRHLFHLSQYGDYYHNERLAFQQHWPLDGGKGVYTGYPDLWEHDDRGFQLQAPIGTQADPFLGSYNGNRLPIRRVAFQIPEKEKNRVCAGLFGSSGGTLENIVYSLNPDPSEHPDLDQALTPRPVTFPSSELQTHLGALVGLNTFNGEIINCAVDSVSLTSQVYDAHIYIGGLCGTNHGTIRGSAAECAYLHADASNFGCAYVGGLTGYNSGRIDTSYAVGRLAAKAVQENAHVYLGGFVSQNSGSISRSYCAMDLKVDGGNAKAYGFCASTSGGRPDGTCLYLNDGNFSYRGEDFLAKYDEAENSGALPIAYIDLTAEASPVDGMDSLGGKDPEGVFPYPAVVSGRQGLTHYGGWPKPLKLGNMGVYYWEELQIPGKAPSYHVSLLAVDPGENAGAPKTVTKLSTLSTAHDQGGEVTRYGYGIFDKKSSNGQVLTTATLVDNTPFPLLYEDGVSAGKTFNQAKYQALEEAKKNDPKNADRLVDEELARLMAYELGAGYQFHSFHTYSTDGSRDGLYPDSTPAAPNGTLTLHQGGSQEVTVTFALNPLFADALAVEIPADGSWSAKGVPTFTSQQSGWPQEWTLSGDTPGSSKDTPYGVRSIDQLQFIDWNSQYRNTDTVLGASAQGGTVDVISNFPYLSSSGTTGKYFWKQSYDVVGEQSRQADYSGYSPIAEYYDVTKDGRYGAKLYGWFGGTFDGGTYMIKDVWITGQQSSCAGLFGVVYDGSLENIVLYSSDGKGRIDTKANQDGSRTESAWYAMGALAGVAGTSDHTQTAIRNCSAAGYTVLAEVYTDSGGWGGNNIGGLVGSSHMNFSDCSAVVDIVVQNAYENDNMRVGGLSGVCLGSLTSCYAGGSITLDADTVKLGDPAGHGIYIGGLVGGSYMRPLYLGSSNQTIGFVDDNAGLCSNTLTNCYSYVRLPKYVAQNNQFAIKGMFVVGGSGEILEQSSSKNHGTSTLKNCYYLESESLSVTSAQTILGAGIRTDLNGQSGLQDGGLTPGEEYPMASKFRRITENYWQVSQLKDVKTGNTESITNDYYYREGLTPEKGIGLFQLTTVPASGSWIYKFVGWLVDPGDTVWTYTTDPSYFTSGSITGLTYEQLAGTQKEIPGKDPALDIYQLLNAGQSEVFRPVTTAEDGVSIPGKYSYSTGLHPELQDRDYPFPTILTKDEENYHVHYGDWPLKGFRRQTLFDGEGRFELLGGNPIEIDLFVNGTEPHREYLVLTDGVKTGGDWNDTIWESMEASGGDSHVGLIADWKVSAVDAKDIPHLPEAEAGKVYYLLELTPKTDGTDTLHLTYTDPGGLSYRLDVTVHITAAAELRPNRLFMFPNDTVEISVKAADQAGQPLDSRLNGELTLKGDPNCGSSGYLTAKTLLAKAEEGRQPTIRFTTAVPAEAQEEALTLGANADFSYTIPDPAHPGEPAPDYGGGTGGDIRVEIIRPWADQKDSIRFEEVPDGGSTRVICTITLPGSYAVGGEGTLLFAMSGRPSVVPMPNRPEAAWEKDAAGNILLTLTYPRGTTLAAGIPETSVSFSLTMSGEGLVDGEQLHTLTLTVEHPAETPDINPAEAQSMEALPPAGAGQDGPALRREDES